MLPATLTYVVKLEKCQNSILMGDCSQIQEKIQKNVFRFDEAGILEPTYTYMLRPHYESVAFICTFCTF